MDVEQRQMKLRLSRDKAVLGALQSRKRMQHDAQGPKLVLQYDGKEFAFRPDVELIVGETVGRCLVRESLIIAGDNDLTDPQLPAVESMGTFTMGEPMEDKRPGFCSGCHRDFHHYARLVEHIQKEHITAGPFSGARLEEEAAKAQTALAPTQAPKVQAPNAPTK